MADDLRIKIGADITELEAGLTKAGSTVKKFGNETEKAAVQQGKLAKTTSANAVPAMTSFSQVIQDSPYGIRGVANNIQQLTAQFGYLSRSTGGAKAALGAMVSSLAGPAGILFAVSAVTSLLVAYGDEIGDFIFGTDSSTDSTLKLNDAIRAQIGLRKQLNDELSIATRIAKAEAKLAGKSAEEQYAAGKAFSQARITILEQEQKDALEIVKQAAKARDKAQVDGDKETLQKHIDLLKDARKNVLDIEKSINDAKAALYLEDLNEKQRVLDLSNKKTTQTSSKRDKASGLFPTKDQLFKESAEVKIALNAFASEFGLVWGNFVSGVQPLPPLVNPLALTAQEEALNEHIQRLKDALAFFNEEAGYIIQDSLVETFSGIGNAIGEALANGENVAKALGASLLSSMGSVLVQLGELAIATGVGILAIKQALKSLNPVVAIAAGVALVALGAFVGAQGKKISASMGGGSSASSSSVAGSGSSSYSGSSVSSSSSSGGGTYVFEIEGTKLVGVLANTMNRNRALGGSLTLT